LAAKERESGLVALACDLSLAGRISAAGFIDQCGDVGGEILLAHRVRRWSF
jgi:hypothetical protein